MTDYTELVKALRHCYEDDDACATCQRWLADDEWGIKCKGRLISDAAAAIEALQAEVEELKAKKMKLAENSLRFVGKVREFDKRRLEPKRGEWVEREVIQDRMDARIPEWQQAECSVCGKWHTTPYMYCFDDFDYCPNCGAKMEETEDEVHSDI